LIIANGKKKTRKIECLFCIRLPKLTSEIFRESIEKVYVYRQEKIDRQNPQHARNVWNCIGEIPTQNKTA